MCTQGSYDCWIVYLDTAGSIQNQKCLGGSGDDELYQLHPTSDGGFVFCGLTTSNDGDVSGLHGPVDAWLAKADSTGILQWQTCLGGYSVESGFALDQTFDNGVIMVGATLSNDSIIISHGMEDYYVAKTDSVGNLLWSMALGGTNIDKAKAVIQCRDGGYLLAGYTESTNGDVTSNHGGRDMWVVKLAPTNVNTSFESPTVIDFNAHYNSPLEQIDIAFYSSFAKKSFELQLYDISGRKIYNGRGITTNGRNRMEIKTGNLSSGVYFLNLITDFGSNSNKFIVN